MTTIPGVRRNADDDDRSAGGKIVRSRRTPASARSPYARPEPREEPSPSSRNLNWLSGLINPARAIASGAGKIFTTVLGPDSDSSSSSSGGDLDSEYEDDVSLGCDNEMNKVSSFNMKSEKTHLIQQLVMQETFSREECDELIKLIESRVVKGDESISDTEKTPDVRTTAIIEARKWLKDKKSGSSSKLKLQDQMCETNQGVNLSLVSESGMGSPVDMAKTYMHDRPAWSSPSLKHAELRASSPMENYREEISRSIFHSPLQLSEMKRSSLSTGSWNILEEIRKVRAKATEELLATTPNKIDFSSLSPENKSRLGPPTNNKNEAEPGYNTPYKTTYANASLSLELGTTNCSGLPESVVGTEHDRVHNEALHTNNVLAQPQDDKAILATESAGVTDGNQEPNGMNGSRNSAATGHTLSLSAAEQTREPSDKEMIGVVDSSKDKEEVRDIPNEKLEHEAEPSNPVNANDNESIGTGSQNSSNAHQEDQLKDTTQSNRKRKASVTPTGRQTRGNTKRGRGRVK